MTTNSAIPFEAPMDTKDFKDYTAEFANILEDGEVIAAGFTVTPAANAAALGVEISNTPAPALYDSDTSVRFWPQVNVAFQDNAAFNRRGFPAEFEISFTTNQGRSFSKTFCIIIKQL